MLNWSSPNSEHAKNRRELHPNGQFVCYLEEEQKFQLNCGLSVTYISPLLLLLLLLALSAIETSIAGPLRPQKCLVEICNTIRFVEYNWVSSCMPLMTADCTKTDDDGYTD